MAGPGKLSWDSVEVWQKLVAAIIASGVKVRIPTLPDHLPNKANNSIKIDVSSVATHFGTTYDTIENRLRPVKKQAKELKEAVSNGTQDRVVSTRKSPTKPKTPRNAATSFDGQYLLPTSETIAILTWLSSCSCLRRPHHQEYSVQKDPEERRSQAGGDGALVQQQHDGWRRLCGFCSRRVRRAGL
jgi:hypothetical protein